MRNNIPSGERRESKERRNEKVERGGARWSGGCCGSSVVSERG